MRVLVTGARGTLGSEVIARLVRAGHAVVGLVRSGSDVVCNDGARIAAHSFAGDYPPAGVLATVRGDIRRPRLGVDERSYQALLGATDAIVHSAALTSFGRPRQHYQDINVAGTDQVLAFATGGERPVPLIHVSTMYVCGERPGVFRESDLERNQSFGSPYEESKYQAEVMVRAAMQAGLPAAIARPSIIVGTRAPG
jgi:thioester reductase-like protein